MFAPLGFVRGLTPEQIAAVADPQARPPGQPADAPQRDQGRLLADRPAGADHRAAHGDPAQVPRPGSVNVGQPVGTPQAVILEQLERFAAGDAGVQKSTR